MKQEQVNIKAPVCCLMTSHCSQVDPRHLSQPASHAAEGTHKSILHEKTHRISFNNHFFKRECNNFLLCLQIEMDSVLSSHQ